MVEVTTWAFIGGFIVGWMFGWWVLGMERILGSRLVQLEAGPRSKRHPKSVEGLGVKGEGEQ